MDLLQPSDHLSYVKCNFCNTVLAIWKVGILYRRLLDTMTVKCGHCSNLSFLSTRPPLQGQCIDHPPSFQVKFIGKQLPDNSVCDILNSKVVGGRFLNLAMNSSNAFLGEDESTSKLSSSIVDSSSRDSSFIDLKLGRFAGQRDAHCYNFFKGAPILSSSKSSSMPSNRVRASGYKDLSSSKDYHERHKACEVHSKTTKVIVNDIEQRFCLQCSRFHLLAEFDDGKSSCRKRLAGHSERRRKPQVAINSGRAERFLKSYNADSGP